MQTPKVMNAKKIFAVNCTNLSIVLPPTPISTEEGLNSAAEHPVAKESIQGGVSHPKQETEIARTKSASSQNPAQATQNIQSKTTIDIPKRSSSDPKSLPTNSSAQGATGQALPNIPSRTGSRSGVKGNERNGSIASSRRSKPKEKDTSARGDLPTSTTPASAIPVKKKGKGVPRLLSFLNCCSAPEDANPIDSDNQISPPRKTNKLQPSQGRQAAPVRKPDASAAESSTAESKDMSDEKIGGPPYADIKAAEQPKMQDRQPESSSMSKPPTSRSPESKDMKQEEKSAIETPSDQLDGAAADSTRMDIPAEAEASSGQANMPETTLPIPIETSTAAVPIQDNTINDRTPEQEQRDNDIEMAEASPVDDGAVQVAESNQPLPPPPPLAPQSDQSSTSAGANRSSVTSANALSERQTWLLPPIRPEFHGKKCLVLDLDETLVHSSFKVRNDAQIP